MNKEKLTTAHGTYTEFCAATWTAFRRGVITEEEVIEANAKYAKELSEAVLLDQLSDLLVDS